MYDKDNVFAKILRNEIPCKTIYENEHALSFWDINPLSTVHALIIPKGEFIDFYDFLSNATNEEQLGFFKVLHETISILNLKRDFNTITNSHKPPFFVQTVPHFHMHLIGGEKVVEVSDW